MFETPGRCALLYVLFMSCLLFCCGPGRDEGDSALFTLEKVLTIDTESDATAELGLTDIGYFDIDSRGNIFIANPKHKKYSKIKIIEKKLFEPDQRLVLLETTNLL